MNELEISIQSPTKTLRFPEVRLNRGLATYIDKEKALDYLHHSALNAEALSNPRLISTTNIIQNFQNPKIEASPKEKEIYRNENAAEQISGSDNSHLYARLLSTANVIQNLPNQKVSTKNSLITPEMNATDLDAVERGDIETAQKMVMEAAEKAGYTIRAYHGTPDFSFTTFHSDRPFGAIFTSTRRNVSALINMTPEERRATLLSETEDIAREDQIFLREGAKMAMARKKTAQETVSVPTEHHQTAISSADGTKSLKNIDNLARKYQEKSNRPNTFRGYEFRQGNV